MAVENNLHVKILHWLEWLSGLGVCHLMIQMTQEHWAALNSASKISSTWLNSDICDKQTNADRHSMQYQAS